MKGQTIRRTFISIVSLALLFCWVLYLSAQPLPGGTLDPATIAKYVEPLLIPPVMPKTSTIFGKGKIIDYYEIAVRQFKQQVLPGGMPLTTVWSYGSINHPSTFNYPSYTIEARFGRSVRVKWINDLKDGEGKFLPHLLPIDQTLHWANPTGECMMGGMPRPDCRGISPYPYTGPVPMVTHVHGAETTDDSDGYPEAWFLPDAANIPAEIQFRQGTWYNYFKGLAEARTGQAWTPGSAVYDYPNLQRATTLWYHDHALGMTRANVYAGPAGFYLIRGGRGDKNLTYRPPRASDRPWMNMRYTEIPIVIQDRSFNTDGSLFYPDNRAFFEGLPPEDLQIPFIPEDTAAELPSDVSPIWNPEFFGNTIVVNGKTWPFHEVEKRRYRLRLLNGSQSRFLILRFNADVNTPPPVIFWQIGSDGGFLPDPVALEQLLLGPAERADVIVDFSAVAAGTNIVLYNIGPDEPFGGGVPGTDFAVSDPGTTGQVMQFRVTGGSAWDFTQRPNRLRLPVRALLPSPTVTRAITLNEDESQTVTASVNSSGQIVFDPAGLPFGPTSARLGVLDPGSLLSVPKFWMDSVTENPAVGATEIWEIYNFTEDAHPIHVHLVQFEVVNRQNLATNDEGMTIQPATLVPGTETPPEPWENGTKDTVIAYPGQVTRIKATFNRPGRFVWHCHILEHEDNEMMRPYHVGPIPEGVPGG